MFKVFERTGLSILGELASFWTLKFLVAFILFLLDFSFETKCADETFAVMVHQL